MKDMLKSMVITVVLVASIALVGCEDDKNGGGTRGGGTATVTIGHDGYDFSANQAGYSSNYDGETISWQPGSGNNPDYPNNTSYLWWRPNNSGRTRDMGAVTLASVTTIPTTWDTSPNIPALIVGHVIVAECPDGYVKFKVISVDANSMNWDVEVEYEFSSTGTF